MPSTVTTHHRPFGGSAAPRGSSTGALWTAGLGAFLLFAAAATFVAVNWEQIPDSAKFAALVAVTALCLGVQSRLRRSLPATATAVLHLGVLLVPIDVAAVGMWSGWAWPTMLLAQGLTATVVFGAASQVEDSVVLRYATWAGVVLLAGGVGGVTPVPAGVALAVVALGVALAAPRVPVPGLDLGAAAWAALAAFATPLAAAGNAGLPFNGTLADLGLADPSPHPSALATGLVAGLALGVVGARRRNAALVLTGVGAALTGAVTTWIGLRPNGASSLAAVAALCLLATVAGRQYSDHALWGPPTRVLGQLAQVVAGVLTIGFGVLVLLMPVVGDDLRPRPVLGLTAALVAVTWLVAMPPVPQAAAIVGSASIALATGRPEPTAVALALLGAVAVLVAPSMSRRGVANQLGGIAAVTWAPLVVAGNWPLAGGLAVVGALAIAEAAVRASRDTAGPVTAGVATPAPWGVPRGGRPGVRVPGLGPVVPSVGARHWAFGLAMLALAPLGMGAVVVGDAGLPVVAVLGAVVVAWAMAVILDRAVQVPGLAPLAVIPRVAMVGSLLGTGGVRPMELAGVAGLVLALLVADAVRLDEPMLLVGAGAAVPFALGGLAVASGWTVPEASMVVTVAGVVWLGLAGCLPWRWAGPSVVAAMLTGGAGVVMSAGNPVAGWADALIVGVAVTAVGLLIERDDVALLGGAAMTAGVWGLLGLAHVRVSEAYVAPVAALLLAVGMQVRWRHRTTSWLTSAPAVTLLGGAALYERLAGGPPWHAALAGAVGVAAVAAGGGWRLAGPLVVGTALVVVATVHETLGVTATVPTPVWLAIGGVVLLTAGVVMERRGIGPIESGRRLVDVVAERFS